MKRGLRYLPAARRGRRRLGVVGLGVMAAMSLVWQQQATLATFIDVEFAGEVTFTAATLPPITPTTTAKAASVDLSWDAAEGDWATPQYEVDWSAAASGSGASSVYSGAGTSAAHSIGSAANTGRLRVTKVATGATQTCALAQGRVFCWGTNTNGALGLGTTTATNTPSEVAGALAGRIVTDVSVGTNHACAVAGGKAYCWGLATNGRVGNGSTTGTFTTPVPVNTGTMSGTVTSISAGDTHTCAVASDRAYCWGNGANGRLGRGSTSSASSPVAVSVSGVLSGRTVSSVSSGTSHSCAVADGLAFCWGLGTNGRLGNSVTIGNYSSPVAVDTTTGLAGLTVTAVSAGNLHSCAVVGGSAYCWGSAANGRLGNGATTGNQTRPVAVNTSLLTAGSVTAITAGSTHSCSVASGKGYCWGYNNYGQLGNNSITQSATPVAVNTTGVLGGRTVTAISAGVSVSCVVSDSIGSCWGLGTSGQLGNAASLTSRVPVDAAVTGLTCPDGAVLDGTDCSLVQDTDYYYRLGYGIGAWIAPNSSWVKETTKTRAAVSPAASAKTPTSLTVGWDQVSELGDSYAEYVLQRSTVSSGSSPATVYTGSNLTWLDRGGIAASVGNLSVDSISAGTDHTCAVLEGSAYCWGDNATGELGDGTTTARTVPTPVSITGALAGATVTTVSSRENHTCAIADGRVYCWGQNDDGELGNATTTASSVPVAAGSIIDATALATGYMHSCAIADGKVYCWGDNSRGQLGDGTNTTRTTPVQVGGLLSGKTVTAIAAGAAHTCAIAEGLAYCWGSDVSGQLGDNELGADDNSSLPVAVLTSGVLSGLTVTAVTTGEAHTCVIAGGKAYCWGYAALGQLGNNSTILSAAPVAVAAPWAASANLTSLTAGQYSTCVAADGKAYCWGEGANGQLGNGATTNRTTPVAVTTSGVLTGTVTQLAAGSDHVCAVSGAAASCWGENGSGQLGNNSTTDTSQPASVSAVSAPACANGASLITPNTCSLKPGTTYYYRVKFTVDGAINTASDWTGIKTAG